jgi:murein DD-endopeptidase MepM/ murein hydrolase activator NlpD
MKKILMLLSLAVLAFSCVPTFNLPNTFNTSPRISYEKKIKRSFPELAGWQQAHDNALAAPRSISLPHGGKGVFKINGFPVYSYRFDLQAGEVLNTEVLTDSLQNNVFIDLYQTDNITEPIQSNSRNVNSLEFTVRETGTFLLTVQPEANAAYKCTVLINKRPLYAFPVAGKSNAAIQSFWEAPRDGGKRRHEGIDIFAKRGTPVVAVTDGIISDTGDRGLGGKQVWQRSGLFGNSIYYAHLDRIAVAAGSTVKTGDTLGYVGNTGNAKGGPTHLHFGIYEGWQGAVNPLPFVYRHKQIEAKDIEGRTFSKKSRTVKG